MQILSKILLFSRKQQIQKDKKKKMDKDRNLPLKVGSCSFESIIILLIYFLNCRKVLFTRRLLSFSEKYRFKSVRLAILQGIR